ncbi:MAG: hypothetical protein Q9M20_02270 [Mariprofundaceae bacterium]|nr:hypothetical protein [Mariprofundaceae bacterium]
MADETIPGDVLIYTLNYANKGDDDALAVKLVDPIPSDTEYVAGSAFGKGAAITFSIDGKEYEKADALGYMVNGEKVIASPELYTHIQWLVKKISSDDSGVAGFRVRVK